MKKHSAALFTRLDNDFPEQRKVRVAAFIFHPCIVNDLLNKHFNLNKICRIIAYYLSKAHREHAVSDFMSFIEIYRFKFCRTVQQRAFYREYQALV